MLVPRDMSLSGSYRTELKFVLNQSASGRA